MKMIITLCYIILQASFGLAQTNNSSIIFSEEYTEVEIENIKLPQEEFVRIYITKNDSLLIKYINLFTKSENTTKIKLQKNSKYTGYQFDKDSTNLYLLTFSQSNKIGELTSVKVKDKSYERSEISLPEFTSIKNFTFCGSYFFIEFKSRDNSIFFKKYSLDLKTESEIRIASRELKRTESLNIKTRFYDYSNDIFYCVYSIEDPLKQQTECRTIIQGQLSDKIIKFNQPEKKYYKYLYLTKLNSDSILLTGTYNRVQSNSETFYLQTQIMPSAGIITAIVKNEQELISPYFFSFSKMDSIYNFVERKVIRENANKKRVKYNEKGQLDILEFYIVPSTILKSNDEVFVNFNSFSLGDVTGGIGGYMNFHFNLIVKLNIHGELLLANTYNNSEYLTCDGKDGVRAVGDVFRGIEMIDLNRVTVLTSHVFNNKILTVSHNLKNIVVSHINLESLACESRRLIDFPFELGEKKAIGPTYSIMYNNNFYLIGKLNFLTGAMIPKIDSQSFIYKIEID